MSFKGSLAERERAAVTSEVAKKAERPGLSTDGKRAVVTSDLSPIGWHDEGAIVAAIRARNLDPNDWQIDHFVINDWQGISKFSAEPIDLHQLKVWLSPRAAFLMAARTDGPIYHATPMPSPIKAPYLTAVMSDEHAHFLDPDLETAALEWLEDVQPDRLALLGDGGDYATVSRHHDETEHEATVQQNIDAQYAIYRNRRIAMGDRPIDFEEGNHEKNIRKYVGRQAPEILDVVRPGDTHPLLSIPHLLRLDELAITYHTSPLGAYPHSVIWLNPSETALIHGYNVRPDSGQSVMVRIKEWHCNVMMGHVHRRGNVWITVHGTNQRPTREFWGAENPTMRRRGANYVVRENWQMGFSTVTVWPNGDSAPESVVYKDGELLWRGNRWGHKLKGKRVYA